LALGQNFWIVVVAIVVTSAFSVQTLGIISGRTQLSGRWLVRRRSPFPTSGSALVVGKAYALGLLLVSLVVYVAAPIRYHFDPSDLAVYVAGWVAIVGWLLFILRHSRA
jgi:hypothetical protein